MSSPSDDRARALAVAQDFGAEALDLNRRLVAANPADAGSRTRLARCYLQAGRLDEAEAEYREVLRVNPRNLISVGGLETIERQRHQGEVAAEEARVARPTRVRRDGATRPRASSLSTSSEPVPQTFTGFGRGDFAELAGCRRGLVSARFAPRVLDLVRRVNALASSAEMAGIREPGKRQLFRVGRADVHPGHAHWYVFNLGGRWEPQCNIGMYGGHPVGNWVRIGIGFNLTPFEWRGPQHPAKLLARGDPDAPLRIVAEGADPDRAAGVTKVRQYFRRFQEILTSPRRSLFLGWMVKENARLQYNEGGPRLDVREPSQAASLIAEVDPERTGWMFFGKWLRLEDDDEAAVLLDPVTLVRTIDRVFTGLVPLWRALHEPCGSP